ncbi:MAG: penicillin-binding transpeptidase domain-containing protein [Acidimicrobiales bacterium]|jgi:peptidoglycan glycosyltransferase
MINRRIRWLGFVLLACFVVLFLQLNNFQVRQANSLVHNPDNEANLPDPYMLARGDIYSSDGVVLAMSKPTTDGYGELRIYPSATATLFAGITGYESVAVSNATGLELEYNQLLTQHNTPSSTLGQLLTQHKTTDDITLTVSVALQKVAATALAGETGAVVAIDPRSGAILAMYGNPTFNPNLFSLHAGPKGESAYNAVISNYNKLLSSPGDPLINYATAQAKAPGSTFKVVDTSAVFDHVPSLATKVFPTVSYVTLPETSGQKLYNFNGEYCGGTLAEVLLKSCDTSFASVGESLGPKNLYLEASAFGFDTIPPIDLPTGETAASNFPPPQDFAGDTPGLMKSAIGQENVTATTLQMALVAAGIADNGVIMTPHLLDKVIDGEGNLVETYQSHPWRRATSAATAAAVRQLMLGVTENPQGTAYGKFPPYLFPPVAAKTGTAQINAQGCGTYNWLIATAPAGAGETPTVAIAAIVPIPPGSSCVDSTGAQVAGPVVAAVMQKALAMQQ